MAVTSNFDKDYLWKLILDKRTFYQPLQGRMSISDLNNIVIPVCLDFLPMTGTIKSLNNKYPIVELYNSILNIDRPLFRLLGKTYYRKFNDDFTLYFMFIGLYHTRYAIKLDRNILIRLVTDLGRKKVNDIIFIPHYLDIVRFQHSVYKYLFLFESLIDNYYILRKKFWTSEWS